MAEENCGITKKDCELAVNALTKLLCDSGLSEDVDFLVYGSYLGKWRNGLSDLDGIFYFSNTPPFHPSIRPNIRTLQSNIAWLYKKFPFLKSNQFLADVFILDWFHGQDGRFMVYDRDWINTFWQYTAYEMVHGKGKPDTSFINKLNPVSLRNQNEFELAMGLHKLRNYLFFEIPRLPSEMISGRAKEALKFFKVLPRVTTLLIDRPMAKGPDELIRYFNEIDYEPLNDLWRRTDNLGSLELYLKEWHEVGSDTFIKCLECFEWTLIKLVKDFPMKSSR